MKSLIRLLALTTAIGIAGSCSPPAVAQSAPGQPFVVEYYYKAKWGHADEFLRLFKKNHYPLLKKETEMGRMLKVWMDQPRYHHRRRPLGLSRDHCFQERYRRQ
jgi:hypothetical protein